MPHNELYNTILTTYSENQEKSYDVFMYDMPWLSFLAAEGILEDISDKMKEMDLELFFPGALKYYSMFNGRYFWNSVYVCTTGTFFIEKDFV